MTVPATANRAAPRLFHGWTQEEVDLIRRTVAPPDATDHELALYLRLCHVYNLDPFRKELVMVRRRRKMPDGSYEKTVVFVTTRDGYLRAAQRDPGYAGIMSAAVHENDDFEFDTENRKITHRFGKNRGKLIGAWAIAYHKARPPVMGYVPIEEYFDPTSDTWKTHPSAMICKVAEVFVLRRQFAISGIVAREELDLDLHEADQVADAPASQTTLPAPPAPVAARQLSPASRAASRGPDLPSRPARTEKNSTPTPTEFWTAVRAAAAAERTDPIQWVRHRTGGEADVRRIEPSQLIAIYHQALQAVSMPTGNGRDGDAAPATAGTTGDDRHRNALAAVQAAWKARGAGPEEQAAMVKTISRGRTSIPAELSAQELEALSSVLAREGQDEHDAPSEP